MKVFIERRLSPFNNTAIVLPYWRHNGSIIFYRPFNRECSGRGYMFTISVSIMSDLKHFTVKHLYFPLATKYSTQLLKQSSSFTIAWCAGATLSCWKLKGWVWSFLKIGFLFLYILIISCLFLNTQSLFLKTNQ